MQPKNAKTIADAFVLAKRWSSFASPVSILVPLLRTMILTVILASVVLLIAAGSPAAQEAHVDDMDRSIRPGDDFYRYANGGWLATVAIPSGQSSFDTRAIVNAKTIQRVHDLMQSAAAAHARSGSIAQKVGDYYASILDEDSIEARKLTPLAREMAQIAAIKNKASLAAYLGTTLNSEVEGLTANADHIFGLWINQGFADADHNVVHLFQGGLGMPGRDDYIDPSPKMAEGRVQYQTHIAAILKLAGVLDAETKAARILSLEIRMAQAFAPDADAADVFKQNNSWKRADFGVKAPGMDWGAYFASAGLAQHSDFVVWQPSAVSGVSALVASESTDVWKDYLRLHLIEQYASVLPKAMAAQRFPDRNKLAITATNGALGEAVGQLYTQQYFPPAAKASAQAMAANLITAYRARISNLTWMSLPTKKKALAKLAALDLGIGYPDTWIDYSTLDIVRGDALGNMRRAQAFLRLRNLAKLQQSVNPSEWPINAHTPGAIIMFSPNAEFFSAGILQPPYFDGQGDAASNYGAAGATMAHEISHSFDELGNIYDAHGRLGDWWTAEDRADYHAAAAKLVAQFDGYCPLTDLCVNGKQVLSENIADLTGLLVAHDAYILALKDKRDIEINGLSGEQRFFLAFAQRWRKSQDEGALRKQIASDIHSPGEYRSDTVRNVDDWYKAYEITPGDKLYLKPQDRVRIW